MPPSSDPPAPGLAGSEAAGSEMVGSALETGEAIARRKLLKQAAWVVPAIVSTVTVSARAAQATCTPTCTPAPPPPPVQGAACSPSNDKPAR